MPELITALEQINKSVDELVIVLDKFKGQIQNLHDTKGFEQELLSSRLEAALTYFSKELTMQVLNPVNKNIRVKMKTKVQQHLQQLLIKFRQTVESRLSMMQNALDQLKTPIPASDYISWIIKNKTQVNEKPGSQTGNNNSVNLQLF